MGKELQEFEEDPKTDINLESIRATVKKAPIEKRLASMAFMDLGLNDSPQSPAHWPSNWVDVWKKKE